MIKSEFGTIELSGDYNNYSITLRFLSQFEEQDMYLATINETSLDHLIHELEKIKSHFIDLRKRRKEIIKTIDLTKIYNDMDYKYNPYPIQMTRAEAFGHALNDGIIDKETYDAIRIHYRNLWSYVGD